MNQSFFCMRFKPNNLELYAEAVEQYDEQKLIVGETGKETLNVKKSQGRKAYDIVRLQDVFNFLISPELKRDLELANLTGWSTYEIKSDDIEKGYSGFICNGKCGTPNKTETSGFKLGFNFDIKIWDGSDFFIPKTTLMILCTEKAKNVISKKNIENIEFININALKWYSI